jgi:hypothetical protein
MGYIKHNAIIVTGDADSASQARNIADILGLYASPIMCSQNNGYYSFFIPPDGSKEGWPDSLEHDKLRQRFKEVLKEKIDVFVDWVEVSYGGDTDRPLIVNHSDE